MRFSSESGHGSEDVSWTLAEGIFIAALLYSIWYKFYIFDLSIAKTFRLTLPVFAGGMGAALCAASPFLLLPPRLRAPCLLLLDILLSLMIITDAIMLRYFADLFSLRNMGLSAQAAEVSDSALTLARAGDAKYFADIPFFSLMAFIISRRRRRGNRWFRRIAAVCLLMMIGAAGIAWERADYRKHVPGALRALWDRLAVARSTGVLFYHSADAINIAGEIWAKQSYSAAEAKNIEEWFASRGEEANGRANGETFGAAAGLHLIIIQVESLQAFVVGMKIRGEEITPNLNRIANESVFSPALYNQTAGGNSSDAEFLANCSLYPTSKGVAFVRFAGNKYNSLALELASRGYSTAAFHGDRPGFWNRINMYPSIGFKKFISTMDFERGEGIGLGLSDGDFFNQTLGYLSKMREEGKPICAFLVTLTSHYPFNFPRIKEHVAPISSDDVKGGVVRNYLDAIRYTDKCVGEFMAGLEREGLLNESVIVLYGDHPAIPAADAGDLGAALGVDTSSPARWRALQSVPLMIRLPHGRFAQKIAVPAGQIDISPTVAALMGFHMKFAFGDDLLAPASSEDKTVIFRNGSCVIGDRWIQPNGASYNLITGAPEGASEENAAAIERAARRLRMSDAILENNLLQKFSAR
ncbi:sulfatase [Synergistales bacterium]|nr:sulfatase [Synergistales bacterium]